MKAFILFTTITLFSLSLAAQGPFVLKALTAGSLVTSRKVEQIVTQGVMSPRTVAANYLVTHSEIKQKVQEGYFLKKSSSVTIPNDNLCITVTEAKAWLNLDESQLPANGRMPLWQELAPTVQCTGEDKKVINEVCETGNKVWTRSEYDSSIGMYKCYYVYKWSDGSQSPEYYELNGAGCIV